MPDVKKSFFGDVPVRFKDMGDGTFANVVSADVVYTSPSGVSAVAGTFTAIGNSAAFTPIAGRSFNINLSGTWAGTVRLTRSFDSGSTWNPITANGSALMTFTANCSEQWSDDEFGVQYRLECTAYTSGTATYRISQ